MSANNHQHTEAIVSNSVSDSCANDQPRHVGAASSISSVRRSRALISQDVVEESHLDVENWSDEMIEVALEMMNEFSVDDWIGFVNDIDSNQQ